MSDATAQLDARFTCVQGLTQMSHCTTQAPLKIAKTFPFAGGVHVCVMDSSPGLLSGDKYELAWHLTEGTHVLVTTQGFTRVHPSRGHPCRLHQEIKIAENAVLEYFPEPLMLYKDAALRSECEIEIAGGGTLLFAEIICAGRIGHGENFQFAWLENRLRVCSGNELIFLNQTALRPFSFEPRRLGAWGAFNHYGSFYVFSERADDKLCELLREVLENKNQVEGTLVWGGVSRLDRYGVSALFLGRRACDMQHASQRLRVAARDYLCA